MTSYSTLIETMHLFCTVFELLSLISPKLKTPRDRDTPTQGTVCNPNAKASHGEPVYTSGSAIAEGPREALVSRNPATTKHLT